MGLEKLGKDEPEVIRAFGAFGGGIGGSANVCGALLAGVAVISSLYSRSNLQEKENPRMWKLSHLFMDRFAELCQVHGGIHCKDIARVNWQDREQARTFYKDPESRRQICIQLVGDTACVLGELLEQETAREAR